MFESDKQRLALGITLLLLAALSMTIGSDIEPGEHQETTISVPDNREASEGVEFETLNQYEQHAFKKAIASDGWYTKEHPTNMTLFTGVQGVEYAGVTYPLVVDSTETEPNDSFTFVGFIFVVSGLTGAGVTLFYGMECIT